MLDASFLTFRLQPHFRNFNKRVTKSPKFYFFDTGLLCFLLRIRTADQLASHPLRGSIFENWVVAELYKSYTVRACDPALYFWRDQHGHEIDIVVDHGTSLLPIEIKSSQTFNPDFLRTLTWFNNLQGSDQGTIVYGGEDGFTFKHTNVVSWSTLTDLDATL